MTEENVFTRTLGAIIANSISVNYNGHAEVEFRELKQNYLANKFREAYTAETKLLDKLKITDKTVRDMVEERVTMYSDIITDILELNETNQKRVVNLIKKLRIEERSKNESM